MQLFETVMIDGNELTERVKDENKNLMDKSFNLVLNDDDGDNKDIQSVPPYICHLFENIIQQTELMTVDVGCVNKDFLYEDEAGDKFYGGLLFRSFHFTDNDNIKRKIINKLYTSLATFYIVT